MRIASEFNAAGENSATRAYLPTKTNGRGKMSVMHGYEKQYRIVVDKELKNANNGQSKHWSASHKERKAWVNALANAYVVSKNGTEFHLDAYLACGAPDDLQGLVITRWLGKGQRLWDADSVLRGNAKQLVDSLIEAGVARDDSPKYIKFVHGLQCDSQRSELKSGYVTIDVYRESE